MKLLIAEERFHTMEELGEAITRLTRRGKYSPDAQTYVKLYVNEDVGNYAIMARLWEESLTDGSKVYELHILS